MALSQTARSPKLSHLFPVALALLLAFGLVTMHLDRDSLWYDEGYTLYVVRDTEPLRSWQPLDMARHVLTSLRTAVARTRADVHPPLYFILLDSWTLIVGESVLAVRLLSTFSGLIGLAATYALGKRLFNQRIGISALLVLATAGMFVYYSREARMYTLLLALGALATLAYVRWRDRPTIWRALGYGGLLAALVYTHYVGAGIALTHLVHWLLTRPRRSGRFMLPGLIAVLLYLPWLPAVYWQFTTHGGAAAIPFADFQVALAALIYFLTGGYWWLYGLPVAMAGLQMTLARFGERESGSVILLLFLWLIVTPLSLLLLNGTVRALFQVRYAIGILPAAALLVGYGISAIPAGLFAKTRQAASLPLRRFDRGGAVIFLALLLYTNLTIYPFVWAAKPDWQGTVQRMAATRQPLEPAITLIPETIPAAYYARHYPVQQGIALDLAWRWQESYDIARYVAHLGSAESVWLVMPSTYASTWDAARDLLATRAVGYRDSVMNQVFYRFDVGEGGDFLFTFADRLAYAGGIRHQLFAVPGEDFCFTVELRVLVDLEREYAADLYLTQGYGTIRAITTQSLGQPLAGETLTLATCLPIAPDNPLGPHHLRLRVYHPASNQALPLLENGTVYWSDELIFALVSVG